MEGQCCIRELLCDPSGCRYISDCSCQTNLKPVVLIHRPVPVTRTGKNKPSARRHVRERERESDDEGTKMKFRNEQSTPCAIYTLSPFPLLLIIPVSPRPPRFVTPEVLQQQRDDIPTRHRLLTSSSVPNPRRPRGRNTRLTSVSIVLINLSNPFT